MSTDTQPQATWKLIASDSRTDSDGIIHISHHLVHSETGFEFTVSVSGSEEASIDKFVRALQAASSVVEHLSGAGALNVRTLQ